MDPYGWDQYRTQSSAPYGARGSSVSVPDRHSSPGEQLTWVVLVLGVATYLLSYAVASGPGGIGWGVRFSTLAATAAALGVLPRQSPRTKLIAGLAIMGFLEALARWINGSSDQQPGWPTIVIAVVTAAQAIAAIAALLAQPRARPAAQRGSGYYDTDAYHAQPAQQYYAANPQPPQQYPVQGQATAQAEAAAPARAEQTAAERDALYAEYLNASHTYPNASASSGGFTPSAEPGSGGLPTTGPTEGIRPRNEPPPGSASQSWQ